MQQVASRGALPVEIVSRHMRRAPVDVHALARDLGLQVEAVPMTDSASGRIECEKDGPCKISVNMYHPRTRQRFTIAHEIAHYVLHRDLIGDGVSDDGLYRSVSLPSRIERQANRYAAEILMPWRLVQEKYNSGLRTANAMAEAFDVSPAVADIRLQELRPILNPPAPFLMDDAG